MMVDARVFCVVEKTVYRVLSKADLLSRWKRSERSSGGFVNRDVAAFIKTHNLIDPKRRPRHPASNGTFERISGTLRDEIDDDYGVNYLQTEVIIAKLMHHYNEVRVHATLEYMTLATWHRGNRNNFENRVQGELLRSVHIGN